jgi:hypothetical protein
MTARVPLRTCNRNGALFGIRTKFLYTRLPFVTVLSARRCLHGHEIDSRCSFDVHFSGQLTSYNQFIIVIVDGYCDHFLNTSDIDSLITTL